MLGIETKPKIARYVSDGRVGCPLVASGDVDVERCFDCSHLREVDDAISVIVCGPPEPRSRLVERFLRW